MVRTKGEESVVAIYKANDGVVTLDVKFKGDSIWLTQAQIAELFNTERSVITKHLNDIFKSFELDGKSNVQKMHIAGSDKPVKYYSLDATISVGYRVNSKKATQFRIWATRVLKEHLLKGYTVNQKFLLSQRNKLKELQTTINFLEDHAKNDQLRGQGLELLSLVKDYTRSLNLLEQYDNKKFTKRKGGQSSLSDHQRSSFPRRQQACRFSAVHHLPRSKQLFVSTFRRKENQ